MDRRTFLSWVGVGTLASSLPVVLAACTSSDSPEASSPEGSDTAESAAPATTADGFTEVGKLADLESNGSVVMEDFGGAPYSSFSILMTKPKSLRSKINVPIVNALLIGMQKKGPWIAPAMVPSSRQMGPLPTVLQKTHFLPMKRR